MRMILGSLTRRMLLRLPQISDDLALVLVFSLSGLGLSLWLLAQVSHALADPLRALPLH
jgi:hypothetical protein